MLYRIVRTSKKTRIVFMTFVLINMIIRRIYLSKESVKKYSDQQIVIPVLVLACNRVGVEKTIADLLRYRENPDVFPLIVSQDGNHSLTRETIWSFGNQIHYWEHYEPDHLEYLKILPVEERSHKDYYKIARHYGWALNNTFAEFKSDFLIIVEDDLNIAPDFFEYFLGTYKLLKMDKTLFCISAWNDNGRPEFINESRPELLHRTDFFPGLGWMLSRELWENELSQKWPPAYWDDWLREPKQRKGRACIRPEISRTTTFGRIGVSHGESFDDFLKYMKLNDQPVEFLKMNLTYLLKQNYDPYFKELVYKSPLITMNVLESDFHTITGSARIEYKNIIEFRSYVIQIGLMSDFRIDCFRTSYLGIVPFIYKNKQVYLAPPQLNHGF